MSNRRETWWTVKYVDRSGGPEQMWVHASRDKRTAKNHAKNLAGYDAINVRVVPCDPPVLRHPIRAK